MKPGKRLTARTVEGKIVDALVDINTLYGAGDIEVVDFKREQLMVKKQYGTSWHKFSSQVGVLKFRGHKRKIL